MELEHPKLLLVGTDKESQTLRLFPVSNPDLIKRVAIAVASKSGAANGAQEPVHCLVANIQGQHEHVPYEQFLSAFGLTNEDVKKPQPVADTKPPANKTGVPVPETNAGG